MIASARNRWMGVCLPAVAISLLYVWGYHRPASLSLAAAESALLEAQAKAPPMELVAARRAQMELLSTNVAARRERAATLKSGATTLSSVNASSSADRAVSVRKLTSTLGGHGLTLTSSKAIEAAAATSLPADTETLAKKLVQDYGFRKPRLWQVQAAGPYAGMLASLKELAACRELIVPMTIEMQRSESDENALEWTLILWL